MANDELDMLRTISAPPPGRDAKSRALQAALAAYDLWTQLRPRRR